MPVKMSTLTIPLGIDSLEIISQTIDTQGNIIIDVESTATSTPCHKCGQSTSKKLRTIHFKEV